MVTLRVKNQKVSIRTSYKELKAKDLEIDESSPRSILAGLSDARPGLIYSLSAEEIASLYPLISFVENPQEAALYLPFRFNPEIVDIASESFEKIELAKRAAERFKKPFRVLPELCSVYYGYKPDRPAAEALALGALIMEQMATFFDRFKDLAGDPPDEDQQEAGIEALHTFGPYGIAESIAARYGCRPLEVFSWSAEEVYMNMLYSQARNKYQENLREIEKRKSAPARK